MATTKCRGRTIRQKADSILPRIGRIQHRFRPIYDRAWSHYVMAVRSGIPEPKAWEQYRKEAAPARKLWDDANEQRSLRNSLLSEAKTVCQAHFKTTRA